MVPSLNLSNVASDKKADWKNLHPEGSTWIGLIPWKMSDVIILFSSHPWLNFGVIESKHCEVEGMHETLHCTWKQLSACLFLKGHTLLVSGDCQLNCQVKNNLVLWWETLPYHWLMEPPVWLSGLLMWEFIFSFNTPAIQATQPSSNMLCSGSCHAIAEICSKCGAGGTIDRLSWSSWNQTCWQHDQGQSQELWEGFA